MLMRGTEVDLVVLERAAPLRDEAERVEDGGRVTKRLMTTEQDVLYSKVPSLRVSVLLCHR